jgi:hypothetical protein
MSYFGIPIRNGLPIGLGSVAPLGINTFSPFSPASLFANNEQGWWYDPSNFATLFQDSAGTTPVTAVEQPVGLQLDLSGRGNHRRQTTSANRPVVSARVNLLTKTEDITDGSWIRYSATTPNATTIQDTAANAFHYIDRNPTISFITGVSYTFRARLEKGTVGFGGIHIQDGTARGCSIDLTTGQTGTPYGGATATSVADGSGWILTVIATAGATATGTVAIYMSASNTLAAYTGTGTGTITATKADLRVTNQGVGLPAYQRVNTSTDYDSTGFPVYIKPNGSNQFMVTNSINFTATDKMTVWQGVRKLSDASIQMLYELSDNSNANNGVFNSVPGYSGIGSGVGAYWNISSKGTIAQAAVTAATFPAPATAVQSQQSDISGDRVTLRINGVQVAQSTGDQGTGNYGNFPAYFYMRAGSSLPFNGNDYGSIARGAASTAAQIANGEAYINSKTKAYT